MYPAWLPEHLRPFWDAAPVDLYRALVVGESEGEPYDGMLGVAFALQNRRIYASRGLTWFDPESDTVNALAKHQFSCFWSDWHVRGHVMTRALTAPAIFRLAHEAALAVVNGTAEDVTVGADHYVTTAIAAKTWWTSKFERTVVIGHHSFYRSYSA
jgi:hypothetical protein